MLNQPSAPAPTRVASPTREQAAWIRKNPGYMRLSQARLGQFAKRGTLRADGTFIAESSQFPVRDGGGDISVGVPVATKRKR